MDFWSQKLIRTYYQCLESTITAHLNCSFLLTLPLKSITCVITILIPAYSRLSPSLIKIDTLPYQNWDLMWSRLPYRLPMGSCWGIGCLYFKLVFKIFPYFSGSHQWLTWLKVVLYCWEESVHLNIATQPLISSCVHAMWTFNRSRYICEGLQ